MSGLTSHQRKRNHDVPINKQVFKKVNANVNTYPGGYIMSSSQLHELWQYEFALAHQWLGLPLRLCSAKPSANWGEKMNDEEFKRLKWRVRTMWSRAGEVFCVTHDKKGCGLKVNDSVSTLSLTGSTCHAFGWLVVCPTVAECPTAHRYLRSPIGENLYLGGPISLINWARTAKATITAKKSSSSLSEVKYMYFINTLRSLDAGTEILWDYGIKREKEFPFKADVVASWVKDCCSDKKALLAKVSALRVPLAPRKRTRELPRQRFCLLCGINVDENRNENMKAHMARKHASEISRELCVDTGAINGTAFLTQLHIATKVLESLKINGYHLVPACHYFITRNISPISSKASVEDKSKCFEEFRKESDAALKHYKVLYLKGITQPLCYEDILPVKETTYADVQWEANTKPAHGLFSIRGKLTDAELITTESIIKSILKDILHH